MLISDIQLEAILVASSIPVEIMSSESGATVLGGSSKYAKAFKIPDQLPETIQDLTREILRNQPKSEREIYIFGMWHYFQMNGVCLLLLVLFLVILFVLFR